MRQEEFPAILMIQMYFRAVLPVGTGTVLSVGPRRVLAEEFRAMLMIQAYFRAMLPVGPGRVIAVGPGR